MRKAGEEARLPAASHPLAVGWILWSGTCSQRKGRRSLRVQLQCPLGTVNNVVLALPCVPGLGSPCVLQGIVRGHLSRTEAV